MSRKIHPNSLKNLSPAWQPGQSGNPNGRPKSDGPSAQQVKKQLQVTFKAMLEEVIKEGDFAGHKVKDMIAKRTVEMLGKCKTVAQFTSILAQIRETVGERPTQEVKASHSIDLSDLEDMPLEQLKAHIVKEYGRDLEYTEFKVIEAPDEE